MFTKLMEINNGIKNYTSISSVTDVCNKFSELGYEVFATPTKHNIDKSLVGATTITEKGKFNYPKFDTYLENISGHPFIGIAAYDNDRFYGVALMSFIEYNNIKLKDLFYPDTSKTINTYATNAIDNTVTHSLSDHTKIKFSSNFNTGNGYTSTEQFSNKNVLWGFINGQNYDGANVQDCQAKTVYELNQDDPDNIHIETIDYNVPLIFPHKQNIYGMCDEDNNIFYWGGMYHMLEHNPECIFYVFTKFVEG